jgi:hypothetical protein
MMLVLYEDLEPTFSGPGKHKWYPIQREAKQARTNRKRNKPMGQERPRKARPEGKSKAFPLLLPLALV